MTPTRIRWTFVLILSLLIAIVWTESQSDTQAYRREVIQARTLLHLQRTLDGVMEQVDEQAQQIETLETALRDAITSHAHDRP